MAVELANQKIMEAREGDGNEGLTINDVTPIGFVLEAPPCSTSTPRMAGLSIGVRLGRCSLLKENLNAASCCTGQLQFR